VSAAFVFNALASWPVVPHTRHHEFQPPFGLPFSLFLPYLSVLPSAGFRLQTPRVRPRTASL
jgi:hypothetical protein